MCGERGLAIGTSKDGTRQMATAGQSLVQVYTMHRGTSSARPRCGHTPSRREGATAPEKVGDLPHKHVIVVTRPAVLLDEEVGQEGIALGLARVDRPVSGCGWLLGAGGACCQGRA